MHSTNMKAVLHHSSSLSDLSVTRKTYLRTRHEGSLYQKRGMEGSMRDLLAQLPPAARKPVRSTQKTQETKNFTQENIKRIRQMSMEKQQRTDDAVKKPIRASWADGGRERTSGRQVMALSKTQVIKPGDRHSAAPLRSQSGLNLKSATESLTASPKPHENSGKSAEKNFVQFNKSTLSATAEMQRNKRSSSASIVRSRSNSVQDLAQVPKAEVGVLPEYLAGKRQAENMAAAWALEAKKHGLQPGCHLMPERERVQLLGDLEAAKRKKEREMFLLPLRSDTLRAQRKREVLEMELREIDQGLTVLSKSLVIVQDSMPHPIKIPPGKNLSPEEREEKVLPMSRKDRSTGANPGDERPVSSKKSSNRQVTVSSGDAGKEKRASDSSSNKKNIRTLQNGLEKRIA